MLNLGKVKTSLVDIHGLRAILVLAIPAMVENLLQVFIGVVDTFFVGRLGTEAIAGVGVTNLTMNVYIAFFMALGVGTTALVSRYFGAEDTEQANNTVRQSLLLSLLVGIVFGGINLLFARNILTILGAETGVVKYAMPYFLMVSVPSVFLCLTMVLSSALRAAGDTKTPMKIALYANIFNAVFDYILIFGVFNLPGLGILGAGLATTLSRMLSVALLIIKLRGSKTIIRLNLKQRWQVDMGLLRSLINVSLPAAVERLIMRSGQLIYGGMIIKIGTEAYAAHNIAGTIETLSYLPGMGFGVAAATLVGQNLGRKNDAEAQRLGLMSFLLSSGFMVVVGFIFLAFAPFLASLFSQDPQVVNYVSNVLRIIAFFQPFLCITLVITACLQGAGDTKFPMYSSLVGIWGVRVLGVYILSLHLGLGLVGVWIAYALDITVRGFILMARFLYGNWKQQQFVTSEVKAVSKQITEIKMHAK